MKILKVIHGYPPRYTAGSEVYSKILCHELARQGHEIIVFTREENAYKQEYEVCWETDPDCDAIRICLVNMPNGRDGYRHAHVDRAFKQVLEDYSPDLVHIGHLNHLSTSLVIEAHKRSIPLVFTLHDFWLMCPRGQFLQTVNSKTLPLYPVCASQKDEKCAKHCYWRYFSSQEDQEDIEYWTRWVAKRMDHIREISSFIDLYVAPSLYLLNRFKTDFGIPSEKIVYLDYGFHRERLEGRQRKSEDDFVFGYIGTHKQAKGIQLLINAFAQLEGKSRLIIWGGSLAPFTQSLKAMIAQMPQKVQASIEWRGDYSNEKIVSDVFDHIDAIVVPSIWGENSPLVIHEAIAVQAPVITADYGGMKEYIQHEVNGLLFPHRDEKGLTEQMARFVADPHLAVKLGQGGYLQSSDKKIPSIQEHVLKMQEHYSDVLDRRKSL